MAPIPQALSQGVLQLPRSNLSNHHLALLRRAGLVIARAARGGVVYHA